MFETNIQNAWENYKEDFGLGRIALFICFFNLFLFILCLLIFGRIYPLWLLPIPICFAFYAFRSSIVKKGNLVIFLMNIIMTNIVITFNYFMVGEFDRMASMLPRRDALLASFDNWLFGGPVALVFENIFMNTGIIASLFYDIIIVSYILYYVFPYFVGILYYQQLPVEKKSRIGRYFASVIIYYSLNYLLYIIIPVTGPQYYMSEYFYNPLPFSWIGLVWYDTINGMQTTFIDCFPSGHAGAAFLFVFWLYRINHMYRFLFTFIWILIMLATLALRYHYTLDLVAVIPLALFSYKLGKYLLPIGVDVLNLRENRY